MSRPRDLVVEADGTEHYDVASWEADCLAEYTTWMREKISVAKSHGLRCHQTPSGQSIYRNRTGQRMIPNTRQTEWFLDSDFCDSCGANQDHLKAHGHLAHCQPMVTA